MKKYKLIREYPGSDAKGTIAVLLETKHIYKGFRFNYSVRHIENSPEFWEEVVEKDYQILKTCPIEGTIYSVKRLSDGEVFTVGDRIKVCQHGSTKTIDSIDLYGNTSSLKEGIWFTYSSGSCHMTYAINQKNLVYLTLNEQDIFEGDTVWYVNRENFYYDYIKAYPEVNFCSERRAYFLTEEEAKNFIIENKPALSIKEFWEITTMSGSNRVKSIVLKELAKKRLNLK
jgi:hypothetical protein